MNQLLNALVSAIGWSLLHFVWQGLLIGWAAALGLHLLRNSRPHARYALACGALLLCAALPLGSIAWRVVEGSSIQLDTWTDGVAAIPAGAVAAHAVALPLLLAPEQVSSWQVALQGLLPWLVLLWAAGAALMTLRLSLGLQWVQARTLPGHYQADPLWQARLNQLARRFGIHRPVQLGISNDGLDGPMTAGCWRPIVLLPASLLSGLPADLLEALLAHELAHIKRHDYLVNLVQSAIEIMLFYHPSVWMLSRRIRLEREQIADDLAASTLGEPRRLALALSELDKFQFSTSTLAPAAHGGDLMSRIKRLVRPDAQPLSWKMAAPLLGLCAACVVMYAQAAPDTAQAYPPAEPVAPVPPVAVPVAPVAPVAPAAPAAMAAPAAPPAPPAPPALAAKAAQPAAPAAPALPAMSPMPPMPPMPLRQLSQEGFGHHSFTSDDKRVAYAVYRAGKNKVSFTTKHDDWSDVTRLKGSVQGDFIWVRKDGKKYVIQDPALLAKVDEAWQPVEKLGAQMDEQGRKMESQGKEMEKLGARIEKEAEAARGSSEQQQEVRKLERKMELLGREQGRIGMQINAVAQRMSTEDGKVKREALDREMQALHARMEPLQRDMAATAQEMGRHHAKLSANSEPMASLHKRMEEAGKPMEEMGRKMGELGAEQGRLGREADKAVRSLIDEAIRSGRATPAG